MPLTNSLYVPGKLADLENVIVDVGTGYYVKKVRRHPRLLSHGTHLIIHLIAVMNQSRAQATQHYSAKVDYIRANLETLQDTIQKKQENLNYLVQVMQIKLQAQATTKESK